MRSSRRPTRSLPLALAVSAILAAWGEATEEDRRVPWTTSHFSGTPDPAPPYAAEPAFPKLVFDRPVLLTHVPGTGDLVVAEVGGRVLSFPNDRRADRAEVALDLSSRPGPFGQLYGLAFHPRFEENRQVFLCYTLRGDRPEGTRVSRFAALGVDPLRIDPESEEVVLTWPSGGHNGGCLAFGPDGFLYISTGDAASPTPPDPLDTGQDITDLLSSILRIDVDRRDPGRAYRVPPDNPFVRHPGARPEVWAYGLRNPWRMSFDRANGDLWVGDVGWEQWELIDRVERGGNYGWSIREGRQPARPEGRRGPTPILPPTADHPHSEAASITGGYVYRGGRLKDLAGAYIYGDYQSGKVWGLRHDGHQVTWRAPLADTGLRLVAFGEDDAGDLFLVEFERTNQLYRLVPNRDVGAVRPFPRTLGATGLFASMRDRVPAPGVVPYAINAESWVDGVRAVRYVAIPGDGRIAVDSKGAWRLPEGSVLARTVSPAAGGRDKDARPLETQVLHLEGGSWRPYTYVWDDDGGDATLADAAGASRPLGARDEYRPGTRPSPAYRVAARSECVQCHNPWVEARTTVFGVQSASPLAFNASQLDRAIPGDPGGKNQLRRLERLGYFDRPLSHDASRPIADPYDEKADLDARARAYLHVNCAHCHLLGAGGSANFALTDSLKLEQTRAVGARPIQGTFGIDDARIIAPGEPGRSVLYYRIAKTGAGRMPRIGSSCVDARGTRLIADWIAQLPGGPTGGLGIPSAAADARLEVDRLLGGSTREALDLVRLIDRGAIPPALLPSIVARTKDHPRAEIRDLFERFAPDDERVERLGDAIDPGAILALTGDPGRGRDWFFDESATRCKSCHRIGGNGVELGPELDAVGAKYGKPELLRHILEPSLAVDPKYAVQTVATADGQLHQGLLVEKTANTLTLRDARNQAIRIPIADIEQQATLPTSLMPEGLLRDLTARQAADLIAYLSALKGR